MNKQWIDDGHIVIRGWGWRSLKRTDKVDYLDLLGLFETNWMTFTFEDRVHRVYYGYPGDE